jgi:hypothetical protein
VKWCSLLALALMLVGVWTSAAQENPAPAKPSDTTDEGDPALAAWQWMEEVRLPAAKAPYYAINLPPSVLGKGRPDLNDLRLADDTGRRIPFALRELRTQVIQQAQPIVRQFDAGPVEAKGYYEVSLELGEVGPLGHNEIEIDTAGKNFRRLVELFGDTKASFEDARQLLDKDKYVVHYEIEGTVIDLRRLRYEPNKVRFLKVRLHADPSNAELIPKIDQVRVRYAEAIKGADMTQPAILEARQPVPANGGPGSEWLIDLGSDPVPCQRLVFGIEGQPVDRPFRIETADPNQSRSFVATRPWTWNKGKDRWQLTIEMQQEVRAQRLRLVVTDFANAPLNLVNVEYAAAVRQMIFALPEGVKLREPIRLFFGNPIASPANYDFARQLPMALTPPPQMVELGERLVNPRYQPPPLSVAERMPWLIYAMLALTSAGLLTMLLILGRGAIRQYDAVHKPA